jgi:hypothetical protein
MKVSLLLALLLLPLTYQPTLAGECTSITGKTHLGAGFYFGTSCPKNPNCVPDNIIQSPALNVSFPNNAGTAYLAPGWAETADFDANGDCAHPQAWRVHAFGTVTYNDGAGLAYTGQAAFDVWYADTTEVALPSQTECCWIGTYPLAHPINRFIYRLKIRSCGSSHVPTNRFIAYGCDSCIEPVWINDPNCRFANMNWIGLSISGF